MKSLKLFFKLLIAVLLVIILFILFWWIVFKTAVKLTRQPYEPLPPIESR